MADEKKWSKEEIQALADKMNEVFPVIENMDEGLMKKVLKDLEGEQGRDDALGIMLSPTHHESRSLARKQAMTRLKGLLLIKSALGQTEDIRNKYLQEMVAQAEMEGLFR